MFLVSWELNFMVLNLGVAPTSVLKTGAPIESANVAIICSNLETVRDRS